MTKQPTAALLLLAALALAACQNPPTPGAPPPRETPNRMGAGVSTQDVLDQASDEVIRSCTIITTEPNALCAPIHDRMPAILERGDYVRWLGERPVTANELQAMLRPYPPNDLASFKIGPRIGNPKFDEPILIQPV